MWGSMDHRKPAFRSCHGRGQAPDRNSAFDAPGLSGGPGRPGRRSSRTGIHHVASRFLGPDQEDFAAGVYGQGRVFALARPGRGDRRCGLAGFRVKPGERDLAAGFPGGNHALDTKRKISEELGPVPKRNDRLRAQGWYETEIEDTGLTDGTADE